MEIFIFDCINFDFINLKFLTELIMMQYKLEKDETYLMDIIIIFIRII